MADKTETVILNSLIGEGSEFRGEFKVKDLIRIDGFFKGSLITEGKILIGKSGLVQTDIRAGIVVVGGEVHGAIHALERVTLLSTGRVFGDIVAKHFIVEEGAVFDGRCTINRV